MLPDHIAIQSAPAPLLADFLSGRQYTRLGVLVDETTFRTCYPLLNKVLPDHEVIVVPAGEEFKTLITCTVIWQKLTDFSFDRHSCLLIIGGGVIGDMGGFCAATFKRGIQFVLMPTTLLAQADASIGGKTGIDFQHVKNHIGVFQTPAATLIATDFLKTLPVRELRSGFAEVIKHCIISDEAAWDKVRTAPLENQNWEMLVAHSVAFKSSVVADDPTEKGRRKILNFGHTIGHAVESYLLGKNDRIFHGEAIALGMICESYIAVEKGWMKRGELEVIAGYISGIFGKIKLPSFDQLAPLLAQDKKNKGDQLLMALPKGIGNAGWDCAVSSEEVRSSLHWYSNR